MVDTLNLILRGLYASNPVTLNKIIAALVDVTEHRIKNGSAVLTGKLPGFSGDVEHALKVVIRRDSISVGNASLCKWFFGDNLHTMTRNDIKAAIDAISDRLGVPMSKANITRLDIGHNIPVSCPVSCYINKLGILPPYKRLPVEKSGVEGVYYKVTCRELAIYDKLKECRAKKVTIPGEYAGAYLLRYELRFKKGVAKEFNVPQATASMLYNEDLFRLCISKWAEMYYKIHKIKDMDFDFNKIQTKTNLSSCATAYMVEKLGGSVIFLQKVAQAQLMQRINKSQAYALRSAITTACQSPKFTHPSTFITELDERVADAVAMLCEINEIGLI